MHIYLYIHKYLIDDKYRRKEYLSTFFFLFWWHIVNNILHFFLLCVVFSINFQLERPRVIGWHWHLSTHVGNCFDYININCRWNYFMDWDSGMNRWRRGNNWQHSLLCSILHGCAMASCFWLFPVALISLSKHWHCEPKYTFLLTLSLQECLN